MELIAPEILKQTLNELAAGQFGSILEKLPIGGALKLHKSEWPRKENCYHYHWRMYGGKLTVKRIKDDYYIIRKQ